MWFYHATPSYGSRTRCLPAVLIFAAPGRSPNKLKTQLVNFFNYVFHSTLRHNRPPPRSPHSTTVFLVRFYRCNRFLFFSGFSFFFSTHFYRFAPPVGPYTTHHTYPRSLLYVYRSPPLGFGHSRLSLICFVCVFSPVRRPFSPHCLYAEIYQPPEQRQQRICTVILIPPSAETSAGHIWRNRGGIATIGGGSGVE